MATRETTIALKAITVINDGEEDHEDNQDELHLQIPPPDEKLPDFLDVDVDELLSFDPPDEGRNLQSSTRALPEDHS